MLRTLKAEKNDDNDDLIAFYEGKRADLLKEINEKIAVGMKKL
jgi:hypothetical protein